MLKLNYKLKHHIPANSRVFFLPGQAGWKHRKMDKDKQKKGILEKPEFECAKGIAIQGYEGSFHQVAARNIYGKFVDVIPCATFRDLIRVASDKNASSGAIMAIENSIAGSILPNYNLLQKSKLKVVAEVYLSISQNLLVNPGVKLEDIKEVHSHPMAILQCLEYLEQYNWKLVETEDTALSAKMVHQHRSKHAAAIASKLAAELFDLEVLAPSIQTMKNNFTRFLVLQREKKPLIFQWPISHLFISKPIIARVY